MKHIWSPEDVRAMVGCIVASDIKQEHWLLAYEVTTVPDRYCLVSLRDGMIQDSYDAETMASILTEENRGPLMKRPSTEEIVKAGMR